jgi:magnesium chelatase family protein
VLFLDELPEFQRRVLEALRQPLEEGWITVARARAALRLPARFQLVAAMNPCSCGFLGDSRRGCSCTPAQLQGYAGRLSGPLLDRIDIRVEVRALTYAELTGPPGEASSSVSARVAAARERQHRRGALNRSLSGASLREIAVPDAAGCRLLGAAVDRYGLSARAHDRVLRVARTIADLDDCGPIATRHLAEALQLRRTEISSTL